MKTLDLTIRLAAVVALLSVSAAALAVTRGQVIQTTATGTNAVYRENVWTGAREFCGVTPGGAYCVTATAPRFEGTPVAP